MYLVFFKKKLFCYFTYEYKLIFEEKIEFESCLMTLCFFFKCTCTLIKKTPFKNLRKNKKQAHAAEAALLEREQYCDNTVPANILIVQINVSLLQLRSKCRYKN